MSVGASENLGEPPLALDDGGDIDLRFLLFFFLDLELFISGFKISGSAYACAFGGGDARGGVGALGGLCWLGGGVALLGGGTLSMGLPQSLQW